jgi:hypothetical protein
MSDKLICTCTYCKKSYVPKKKERNKYCSRECAFAHKSFLSKLNKQKKAELLLKACPQCGNIFKSRGNKRYCSIRCSSLAYLSARKKARYSCKECGSLFEPEYHNKHRVFCSDRCARKYLKRAARSTRNDRIRATSYGAAIIEKIDRSMVYERDSWICGICGEPVAKEARVPSPYAPTLDHIVPLAAGGQHTISNTQCAHFICNSIKGDGTHAPKKVYKTGVGDRRGLSVKKKFPM